MTVLHIQTILHNQLPLLTCYTMHAIDSFFFKAGNPPPTFPIPTLHTMLEFPPRVVPIAHTILSPRSVARRNAIVRVAVLSNSRRSSSPAARAPGRSSSPAAHAPGRSSSPVACAPGRAYINRGRFSPGPVITIQRRPASTSGYDTDSDLTSISGVSPNLFMPDDAPAPAPVPGELMSKPKGEVGRPGRGGYTLEKAVDFNSRTFRAIRVCRALFLPCHIFNRVPFRNACTSCVTSILIPARVSNFKTRTDSGKYATR
jgi:hypothetical protein